MKSILGEIKGEKDAEEGKDPSRVSDQQQYSRPAHAPGRNQSLASLPVLKQNVEQLLAPSAAMRLQPTTSTTPPPLGQLGAFLASPESSSTVGDPRNLIPIQQHPVLCQLCYNLDPNHAPQDNNLFSEPWAETEYRNPGEPFAKIKIENSQDLLESAERGCLYCCLVRSALNAVHPSWEMMVSIPSCLDLFLAPGLPVVIRLHYSGLGARDVELSDTIGETRKPGPDFEIYRPRLGRDQITVNDRILSQLVCHMGYADEIPGHAGDQKCFDFIKKQLKNCMTAHKCGRGGQLPILPDRVIWIEANNSSRIQLLEPKDICAQYIALSYCWGPTSPDTYLTDASTFNARKAGIQYDDLPPLFQDVISCARVLGIEYVWIDRLCIIQGDDQDFRCQGSKMGEFYGNATLTIAAASATSENDHILIARKDHWLASDVDMNVSGIGSLKLRCRPRSHPLGTENIGGDYGKVSTRAWIWQERLLSARTVFYTPSALKFECHCNSVWEGFGPRVRGHSWSAKLDNVTRLSWTNLVEEYTGRDITRPSDRLPAMDSVMKRIQKNQGWSPLFGAWTNSLVESLSWTSRESGGAVACRMNPEHYAPTWSWASVDGPVSYVFARPMGYLGEADPMKYDLEVRGLKATSGLITVAGHAVFVKLNCRIRPKELRESSLAEDKNLEYHYEILDYYPGVKPFPIYPDVPLKPWIRVVDGKYIPTVVRVPYRKTPPKKSWSTHCYCVLVAKTAVKSLVLFLGNSLREPGAWERIGIAYGFPSAIFSFSHQRQDINLV